MNDADLVAHIAREWVDGGGDVAGIYFLVTDIAEAVRAEIAERNKPVASED